jgi:hypothetical protein
MCALPNGHVIAGEYSNATGNAVAEFVWSTASNTYVYERKVYATSLAAGSLSHCTASANTELYLTDYTANSDDDLMLVKLHLSLGASPSWAIKASLHLVKPVTTRASGRLSCPRIIPNYTFSLCVGFQIGSKNSFNVSLRI